MGRQSGRIAAPENVPDLTTADALARGVFPFRKPRYALPGASSPAACAAAASAGSRVARESRMRSASSRYMASAGRLRQHGVRTRERSRRKTPPGKKNGWTHPEPPGGVHFSPAPRPSPPRERTVERPAETYFHHGEKVIQDEYPVSGFDDGTHISTTVKWYDPAKGYGFLIPDDGSSDIYCRAPALAAVGLETLLAGGGGRLRDGARPARSRGLADRCRRLFHRGAPPGVL